jgi:predicted Fe-Mo cluster-binding NifX family protein
MTKIIIPTQNQNGKNAQVAQHFGQAPYYTIIELNNKGEETNIKTTPNTGEHMGGKGHPHDNLLNLKPNIIAAYGMGPNGLLSFKNAGITVLKAQGTTVAEVIDNYKQGTLTELTAGCAHAHHHEHHH